jgi:hypothetical protein
VVGRREAEQEEALISEGRRGMEDAVAQGRAGGGGLGGRHGVDRWGWRRRGVRAGFAGLNGWAGGQWGGQVGRRDTQCRTSSVGSIEREGDAGVGACRGAPSSIGRLDRWVQEMGLRFITLVGEYRYPIYILKDKCPIYIYIERQALL